MPEETSPSTSPSAAFAALKAEYQAIKDRIAKATSDAHRLILESQFGQRLAHLEEIGKAFVDWSDNAPGDAPTADAAPPAPPKGKPAK